MKIPVIFVESPLGAVGYPGGLMQRSFVDSLSAESKRYLEVFWNWSDRLKSGVLDRLRSIFPSVEFEVYSVKYLEDVREIIDELRDSVGILVIDLQGGGDIIGQLAGLGKPMIVIAEALGGGADVLLSHGGYSMSVSESEYVHYLKSLDNYPILMVSTRRIDSEDALGKVRYLEVLDKLRNTHALIVVPGSKMAIWNTLNDVSRITGIKFSVIDGRDFVDRYYSKVGDEEAKPIAEAWVKGAYQYPDPDRQWPEVLKSARLYIAINRVLEDYKANAISIDCLGLRLINKVILDAWPCLAYMQLWLDGKYVPMCEADANSLIVALIGKYLLNTAGSATDPVTDELTGEVTYYHCYLPINPKPGIRLRYSIVPSHAGTRYAAVNVEFPINNEVTAVGLDASSRTMYIHTATVSGNELSAPACATKVIAKANVQQIKRRWGGGWHRVLFLGNHKQEFIEVAKLLGLKIVDENGELT